MLKHPDRDRNPKASSLSQMCTNPLAMLGELFRSLLHAIEAMLVYPPALQEVSQPPLLSLHNGSANTIGRRLEELAEEVVQLFTARLNVQSMLSMSSKMCQQYKEKLDDCLDCMLPSYNYTLPTGQEMGTYLAMDLGGSTFRVALVELRGRTPGQQGLRIIRMSISPIDESVRRLEGTLLFDWMAEKIEAMLAEGPETCGYDNEVLPVGLAWSFPIEQTSLRGGKIQGMGKGFHTSHTVIGQDLGDLIVAACRRRTLNLRVDAIVNDSSAALLCRAYSEPTTSMSLILGTGTNAAVHLPVSCMGTDKFGIRDQSWHAQAEKVITNTELSMFGKGILPETRWDDYLNRTHQLPDFQPLEYMTTGRYLGELFRLVIGEAVDTAGLFDGVFPEPLRTPYTLDTTILARLEADTSAHLSRSGAYLEKLWCMTTPPSQPDLLFLRAVAESISNRAAAYLAVALHALWTLQKETYVNPTTPFGTPKTSIACTGSVIEKYPNFRARCEGFIEEMIAVGDRSFGSFPPELVVLEVIDDAAILGAAVAVAISD
jgi:hexokinase